MPESNKQLHIEPHGRGRPEHRIKPVEETAMAGHDGTAVFNIRHPLEFAFKQITHGAKNSTNGGDGHPMPDGERPGNRYIITRYSDGGYTKKGPSRRSFPCFLGDIFENGVRPIIEPTR